VFANDGNNVRTVANFSDLAVRNQAQASVYPKGTRLVGKAAAKPPELCCFSLTPSMISTEIASLTVARLLLAYALIRALARDVQLSMDKGRMPRWFLIVNGVALLVMGVGLLVLRLRERPLYKHLLGLVWAVLCCAAGIVLLLIAQGHITQPGATRPERPRNLPPEFPQGQ
jgi:hypothetical protein